MSIPTTACVQIRFQLRMVKDACRCHVVPHYGGPSYMVAADEKNCAYSSLVYFV